MLPCGFVKFVCGQCERLVALEDFRVESGTLYARCSKCGAETRSEPKSEAADSLAVPAPVANPPPSAPGAPRPSLTRPTGAHSNEVTLRSPAAEAVSAAAKSVARAFDVPEGFCLKCLSAVQPGKNECPSCGNPYDRKPDLSEPPDWLKEQWLELLTHWDDELRHEKLRRTAVEKQELALVGRFYRLRLARQPTDPIATLGRDEVLRLALFPSGTPALQQRVTEETKPWKWILVAAVFITVTAVLVAFAFTLLKAQ